MSWSGIERYRLAKGIVTVVSFWFVGVLAFFVWWLMTGLEHVYYAIAGKTMPEEW